MRTLNAVAAILLLSDVNELYCSCRPNGIECRMVHRNALPQTCDESGTNVYWRPPKSPRIILS